MAEKLVSKVGSKVRVAGAAVALVISLAATGAVAQAAYPKVYLGTGGSYTRPCGRASATAQVIDWKMALLWCGSSAVATECTGGASITAWTENRSWWYVDRYAIARCD